MIFEEMLKEEREEGFAEGRAKGRAEGLAAICKDAGDCKKVRIRKESRGGRSSGYLIGKRNDRSEVDNEEIWKDSCI